ncbi:hypothetical protein UFOVP1130_148 [uncultured Caudovirales phage]|uniref:Uncharacterized protein n=1 Tax=uncultured Caudovirales phage TaxID=2100421 RepID=A0A6J5QXR7_9CAUD|nr:hypothetical protein UFOVP1130_148 [uncultured Caudovirales phage]
MSASDHLSTRLFHGTDTELETDALITPEHSRLPPGLVSRRVAYATDNYKGAKYFGKHVYEVTPINHEDVWGPEKMDRYDNEPKMNEFTSPTGFKVVRRVSRGK